MNHQQIIEQLRINAYVFAHLFRNLTEEQARWKPAAERWSVRVQRDAVGEFSETRHGHRSSPGRQSCGDRPLLPVDD